MRVWIAKRNAQTGRPADYITFFGGEFLFVAFDYEPTHRQTLEPNRCIALSQ
jgi:hypothetical protein